MANSQLGEIGTTCARTNGLLESRPTSWFDKLIWCELYEEHPENEELRYDRSGVPVPVDGILDKDIFRGSYHNNEHVGLMNLNNNQTISLAQEFMEACKKLDTHYEGNATKQKLYSVAMEFLKNRSEMKNNEQNGSLAPAHEEASKDK